MGLALIRRAISRTIRQFAMLPWCSFGIKDDSDRALASRWASSKASAGVSRTAILLIPFPPLRQTIRSDLRTRLRPFVFTQAFGIDLIGTPCIFLAFLQHAIIRVEDIA